MRWTHPDPLAAVRSWSRLAHRRPVRMIFGDSDAAMLIRPLGRVRRRDITAVAGDPELMLYRDCDILVNRTGMSLLFVYAELRQQIQYCIRLDFKLPRQFINSDLQLHR